MALVIVLGTVAAVSRERAWNGLAIACLAIAILIACAMGAVTYYYHLHEDDQDSENSNGSVALVVTPAPERTTLSDAKFGSWSSSGRCPVDVEYSLIVIDEIRQVVADGLPARLQHWRRARGGLACFTARVNNAL